MKRRAAATIAILLAFVTVQGCRGAAVDQEKTSVTSGKAEKGMTAHAVIDGIVEQAPTRLSALEKIVGGLQRDPKKDFMQLRREIGSGGVGAVEVDYAIDIHHKDPREVEDPDLARYSITFENGMAHCLEILGKKHGAAKVGAKDGGKIFRFDTAPGGHPTTRAGFYVYPAGGDAFSLEWRTTVPDLAFAPQTAGDVKDLEAKIIELLGGDLNRERFQSVFGALTKEEGWNRDIVRTDTWVFEAEPAGAYRPERFTLSFTPSIDAAAIIKALGIKKPVIVSTDVHMTSRIVADYETRAFPTAGGYMIELNVVEENLKPTDLHWPASMVWKAEGCRVDSIEAVAVEPPPPG